MVFRFQVILAYSTKKSLSTICIPWTPDMSMVMHMRKKRGAYKEEAEEEEIRRVRTNWTRKRREEDLKRLGG